MRRKMNSNLCGIICLLRKNSVKDPSTDVLLLHQAGYSIWTTLYGNVSRRAIHKFLKIQKKLCAMKLVGEFYNANFS